MLPLDLPPLRGEAFPGYLHRVAELMEAPTRALYEHLGLRTAGKTLRYVHLNLTEQVRHDLAHELRLESPGDLAHTLVDHFGGLDLRALTGPHARDAHRAVQRNQWLWMSGTRYCPACVREGRVWQNAWQVPWAFACERHHQLLLSACTRCGARPDLVVRTSMSAPSGTPSRCGCGFLWADAEIQGTVDQQGRDLQRRLNAALEDRPQDLWGSPANGHTRLAAWRAAAAATARTPRITAWARRPYLVPPSDAEVTAAVIAEAAPVMTAPDVSAAADALGRVLLDSRGQGESSAWDVFPRSSPIAPVARLLLSRSGRLHSRLARTQRDALPLIEVRADQIPTLADAEYLPEPWKTARLPQLEMRQAALSLAVCRLAGAGTWEAAGRAIGIDGMYAARLVRHTLRSLGPAAAQDVTAAAQRYARLLHAPAPAARRPVVLLAGAKELRRWADAQATLTRAGRAPEC